MALSDNPNEKDKKRNKNRSIVADSNYRWSDKQKLEAVNSYLALGNLALTSRILGIPEITLRVWKASDWWAQLVADIKMEERIVLSSRMKKIVDAAHTIVAQRLEHGDPVVTPKGDVVMKPVSMKDAHKVATDLLDRRKLVDSAENDTSEQGKDNTLEKLAERFADMATKSIQQKFDKQRTVEVEDAYIREMGETESGGEGSLQREGSSLETGESRQMESVPEGTLSGGSGASDSGHESQS
jgi:transposase-like protein